MKISRNGRTIAVLLAAALAGSMLSASLAHAGAKCPNRFFKRIKVEGVGDTEANATIAYNNDLAARIAAAKPDCDKAECEDSTSEVCTFMHTQSKKPKCVPKGPGFKCVGWLRPGCFCMEPDEEVGGSPGAPAGDGKKE